MVKKITKFIQNNRWFVWLGRLLFIAIITSDGSFESAYQHTNIVISWLTFFMLWEILFVLSKKK